MAVRGNLLCLGQVVEVLNHCSKQQYTSRTAECFNSSIGGHIRHILDHYHCFFQGLDNGTIDYDARQRDESIENDPEKGRQLFQQYGDILAALEIPLDRVVRVKMDTGAGHGRGWSTSTVQRELQFLLSHTVHHYALIATICVLSGASVPADFGVAPSTLRYRGESGQ